MIEKYNTIKKDAFEYIQNRIQAGIAPPYIASELQIKYPVFIAFFNSDPEMILEFMTWLTEQAYFLINRRWYGEKILADRDPETQSVDAQGI